MYDYKAKDIMTKDVICVKPDMRINELNKVFIKDSSTGLEPQQMTDDFIKTDTLTFVDATVKDIMKPSVVTAQPDDSIQNLSREMYDKKIHRLVIVEGNKVAGIVSTLDILKIVGTK
jgi:predicted transcriptional regulator